MFRKKFLSFFFSIFFLAQAANAALMIESEDFIEGADLEMSQVYRGLGCEGGNKSPQITIRNVPSAAKSLAVTIYDPDASTGSGWWHWLVYNIPPKINNISSGDMHIAEGVIFGYNDFGTYKFGGACPPRGHGRHRYILTVYALSIPKLNVFPNATAAMIGYNLNSNVIDKATITSYYERK